MKGWFFKLFVFISVLIGVNLWPCYEIPPTSSVVKRVSLAVVLVKGERITKTIKENMLIVNHSYSIGSGFIIGENGYILTCNHIIDGVDTIQVELKSQKKGL